MLRSLTSAISGLQNFQQQMDVIGNNIANVNTPGFKSSRSEFADSFSQTLRESSSGNGTTSGVSAMQVGLGVTTGAIKNVYTQGAMTRTGVKTDLAVEGSGFFLLRDAVSSEALVTRAGNFRLDESGYLVTNSGQRVQGYADSGLSTIGDILIDKTGMPASSDPAADIVSFAIDGEGKLNVSLSDGSEFVRGQVLLQNFTDPQGLVKRGNNLYAGIGAASPLPNPLPPGSPGLGKIQSGSVELSNVDIAQEFSTMITSQRAFQATARIITTSDEMLQELVNMKR